MGRILGSYRLLNTQDNEADAASQGKLSTALNRLMVILQQISTPKMSAATYPLEKMRILICLKAANSRYRHVRILLTPYLCVNLILLILYLVKSNLRFKVYVTHSS